jgi:hypothetical protein
MNKCDETISVEYLVELAEQEKLPFLDLLMIAANREGARYDGDSPRARLQLRPFGQSEVWQIILPLDNPQSSFTLTKSHLYLKDVPVADVVAFENDDVVLTYLRAGGRSLTLNTHSRSTCIGCIFCPNIIEDAADGNVDGASRLEDLLWWTATDNGWPDLSNVEIITICSGCFNTPDAAITHLSELRQAGNKTGFDGHIHLLSSVVRSRTDLKHLRDNVGKSHLTLTLECFSRREILLKSSKASLTLDEACRIADDCADLGIICDFTYVAGLDPLDVSIAGLKKLSQHVTTFPRIQVYQAHNDYMRRYRNSEAESLDYYVKLRKEMEQPFAERGLRPKSWENYRPLWYTSFPQYGVEGPRI